MLSYFWKTLYLFACVTFGAILSSISLSGGEKKYMKT